MSDQLISQLTALQKSLEQQARVLQNLVNQDKQKMRHYAPVMQEAGTIQLEQWFKNLYIFMHTSIDSCSTLFYFHMLRFHILLLCFSLQIQHLNKLAKSKVDLGKALIRAAEKAAKPEKGAEGEGESSTAAATDPPKKKKRQPEPFDH